ncbi:undecaprenyl-phosphate alpha-N-acetylglucosaminyl 1-phosphate transferase [Shewanella sp. NFH-SH190041]|uniref:UDP-N-acetylglucosamine--undecaprenyl-phosphate N-acetylglucosaminephosphotransferase n=1 Tax=Shewanella sp. NFH-SH190041 TaxID=2950245 RepID=UPI0021C33106|nr:UDP-N-acetylglucosamine--undecaprenyl-phosphate N-acetylglucosaminephosphotransferase [Shewanella sp. NFH-SH190041]BDM62837.1 undecaprenyl-phosphate alpha-N-acetylglucosaminyl 1-phosphate transferase [Shewanella sp. NFH-SH190041]
MKEYVLVFILSFIVLFLMRKIAKRIGLVDKPSARKQHKGLIPLVGGISIYLSLFISFMLFVPYQPSLSIYLSCGLVLIVLGALDDYFDLSFKLRLVVQTLVSMVMIYVGDYSLHNLGYLMGSETIKLSEFIGTLVTVFAVIGAINAFNMVDGIDGLLGGLSSVTFGALGVMFYLDGDTYLSTICFMFIVAMLPYILLNLGLPFGKKFKVFMGDAGSMFIGFTVVWLLVKGSQSHGITAFKPVTALWLIAIPLLDMATIMIRRISKGHSPFKPDREHLHHICQRLGFSSKQTLCLICSLSALFAIIGIVSDIYKIAEFAMFYIFLIISLTYYLLIFYVEKLYIDIKGYV